MDGVHSSARALGEGYFGVKYLPVAYMDEGVGCVSGCGRTCLRWKLVLPRRSLVWYNILYTDERCTKCERR